MRILSLFDGLSAVRVAMERLGVTPELYLASEIDRYCIQISQKNYPDIVQIGDVTLLNGKDYQPIDLLVGGSPCQGFSFAGKQLNFDDPRSGLFFEFVRLLDEVAPKYFLLENVKMKQEFQQIITEYLGVPPIEINSALVSAQNRKRLYWTNIPGITQPEDRGIKLKDILLSDADEPMLSNVYGGFKEKNPRLHFGKSVTIRTASGGGHIPSVAYKDLAALKRTDKALQYMNKKVKGGRNHWDFKHHTDSSKDKSPALVKNLYKGVPYNVLKDKNLVRKLHPIEAERLQTLPDNYTEGVSNTQRYKMLGNAFTVEVIKHVVKDIAQPNPIRKENK